LDDVEGQLQGAGSVAAVDGGESIIVFCTPDSEGAVRESLKDLSARLHVPASSLRLRVIDSFPLLSNGKIDYQQLGQHLDSSGN
jgi:acyl-CoA synthetase (AMP-forming)/AMP-acid ligase II